MQIIKDFAFGLEWRNTEGSKRSTLATFRREGRRPRSFVSVKANDGSVSFGFSEKNLQKQELPSAAAFLATHPDFSSMGNVAFLFQVEEGVFSLICISNGLPVTGFDFIGSADDCVLLLEEFHQVAASQGAVVIFSSELMQGAQDFNFDALVSRRISLGPKDPICLQTLTPPVVIFSTVGGILALLLLANFGYGYYQDYKTQKVREEEAAMLAAQEAAKTQPEALFNQAVASVVQEASNSIDVASLWNHYSAIPSRFQSWRRESVKCDALGCLETFKPAVRDFAKWADWSGHEGQLLLNFSTHTVQTSKPSFQVAKPDDPINFFGVTDGLYAWTDVMSALRAGTLTVSPKKQLPTIPVLGDKGDFGFYEIEYQGPLWAIEVPMNLKGLSIHSLSITTKEDLLDVEINKESVADRGQVSFKGIYYVKD